MRVKRANGSVGLPGWKLWVLPWTKVLPINFRGLKTAANMIPTPQISAQRTQVLQRQSLAFGKIHAGSPGPLALLLEEFRPHRPVSNLLHGALPIVVNYFVWRCGHKPSRRPYIASLLSFLPRTIRLSVD
eukprot:scaffold150533_cov41-Prasinocladus_malaysianus.AAC.1